MGGRDGDMGTDLETNENLHPQDRRVNGKSFSFLAKQTVYNWHPGAPVNDRGLGLNKMKGFLRLRSKHRF